MAVFWALPPEEFDFSKAWQLAVMDKMIWVGLTLLCSKTFQLFFLAILSFFLNYYSQNYARNSYDSPNYVHNLAT